MLFGRAEVAAAGAVAAYVDLTQKGKVPPLQAPRRLSEGAVLEVDPANTRVQAGLPAPGAFGSPEASSHIDATRDPSTEPLGPRPGETEIVEDIYED